MAFFSSRRRLLWAAAGLVLVLLAAGLAWRLLPRGGADPGRDHPVSLWRRGRPGRRRERGAVHLCGAPQRPRRSGLWGSGDPHRPRLLTLFLSQDLPGCEKGGAHRQPAGFCGPVCPPAGPAFRRPPGRGHPGAGGPQRRGKGGPCLSAGHGELIVSTFAPRPAGRGFFCLGGKKAARI